MITRTCLIVGVTCLAWGLAGCQAPQRPGPSVIVSEESLTIEQVALRLGLRIEQRDETFVILRNASHTVIVFTHADGRFFVNGRPAGSVGDARTVGDTVYVPARLVDQIRPHLETAVAAPPAPVRPRRTTGLVVIDAGHGGHDPGAISPCGLHEKNINLRVAAKVANTLEQRGVGVVMTRWQDRFIELEERSAIANRRKADLFVSLHADSAPNRSAQGFTIYIAPSASADTHRAAHAISRTMEKTGMNNRGVREASFQVLVNTHGPAVLIEMGYLTNPQDAARLGDDRFRDRLAEAIVEGIQAYLR